MTTITTEEIHIIGLAVRTSNENGQSGMDIPALWNRFMTGKAAMQIPGKIDDALYCIYTEYEKDHTRPYTTVLGCRVGALTEIPAGFKGITIDGGNYAHFVAKGDLNDNAVFNEWQKIWNTDLSRTYTSDYEVYGARALDPENAEVDIYIAV